MLRKNSDYFNNLPYSMQETVLHSGMKFENDEEMNMYLNSDHGRRELMNEPASRAPFYGTYPYGLGIWWPF